MTEFAAQWVFQLERGEISEKDHYQCRMILEDGQMTETMLTIFEARGFDRRDVTFHPESNNSIQQGGLSFYVMKDETRILGPWTDPSYQTKREGWVPEMCKVIVDAPRPWMTSLLAILKSPPHHRAITWVCTLDGLGGVGKSLFNVYLEATGKACFLGSGTPTQILEATIAEGERRAYTLDLPKTQDSNIRIGDYINVLEVVKNGFIKTAMHGKRKKLIMNQRPHLVVFSNILPPLHTMTEGRFHVYTIDPTLPSDSQCLLWNDPNPDEGGVAV